MKHNRFAARTLIAALALGIAVDLLFHGHALGISFLLFVLLVLAALFFLGWQEGVRPAWPNLWLLLPLLLLAGMVAVRANSFLTFLNVVGSLALLGLVADFFAAGRVERLGLPGYPLVWLRTGGNALLRAGPLLAEVQREAGLGQSRRNLLPVVRGLLLALPVLAVFTCLLSSADLVFSSYVADLFRLRFWRELLGRGAVVLGAAWVLAGGLAYALLRSDKGEEEGVVGQLLDGIAVALGRGEPVQGEDALDRALTAVARVVRLGFVEAVVILAAVELLLFFFVGIQLTYLFGGAANIGERGFTYAEYVHRGFGELVAVAVLTLGLVLTLQWLARRDTPGQSRAFNGLASVMVGLVMAILASAFQRMRLYELAYGYTELRLYVYVFMAWLGAVFLWLVFSLWWVPKRFAVGALVAALGFVITLNLINPDAFIARRNLGRYWAGGKLDAWYLTTLSEDATPVLVAAAGEVAREEQEVLLAGLRRHEMMQSDARRQGWPAAHLARWRAHHLLERMRLPE
jgi:hypothetical protein